MEHNWKLLEALCAVQATSGNEESMKNFLLDYILQNQKDWKVQPTLAHGDGFMDCLVLTFGKPRTAVFAHIDSIGFTVRYDNKLIPIGGPELENSTLLEGEDAIGKIETRLVADKEGEVLCVDFSRSIAPGTALTFKPNFRQHGDYIQNCYLDNRLGVYMALRLAETLENGAIVFSCWEEHGGGTVPFLLKYLMETTPVKQCLVLDITWITEGVRHGKGTVISHRDRSIPRQQFVKKLCNIAASHGIDYQVEVEAFGGSDGREIQQSPYALDWCFIGPPEDNVHTADEIVHIKDVDDTLKLYTVLMQEL